MVADSVVPPGLAVTGPGRLGRIPIRDLRPRQHENLWAANSFVGEVVPFEATVFREGHDLLRVELELFDPSGTETRHPMTETAKGTDRMRADVLIDTPGLWRWRVSASSDDWATWLHAADLKLHPQQILTGQDADVIFADGVALLELGWGKVFADAARALGDTGLTPAARLKVAHDARLAKAISAHPLVSLTTTSDEQILRVERARAAVGSWYEFFPRSEGAQKAKDGSWTSGTFRTAAKRLPAVAAMGFDVVYLPPIHPIGTAFRKGPNNAAEAGPNDPGSPWAIGGALADGTAGGHDSIHPDLGTLADFRFFLAQAQANALEVALDLALQCSPDHPWVTEHPEWFTHRSDGSIAYAENPPKRYQDIYPLNFDTDPEGLSAEVLRIVEYWIAQGVEIFRVDNPHTKPLWFWEWLLTRVAETHPEVVFLAEAFTRPPMLAALAEAGFQQSYTYFAWRNTKPELEEFLHDLATESADYLHPNLFVNTPDILTEFLQFGGPPAYKIRAAIAATASPSWGVYAGYELFEDVARPGSEENLDNEKYEFKQRDWARADTTGRTLAPYLRRLNAIRREHPALLQLRNLRVHWSDDDSVLVYSKFLAAEFTGAGGPDGIIVVANLDPHAVRETIVHLDVRELGLEPGAPFDVHELITDQKWTWKESDFVRLDAFTEPVHILSVQYGKSH
ncbi:MAG: maltotransferase domain-containing protein [Pseudolysinimonas sp.]|uniref:alpha-1,4-glucan--maltose-1-phosphate maltosyltransferase n=1 Tax=Pseudolysinimonas sp. TaxID=2680009 RepID=UPI003262FA06